jgi:cyclomaltodextrinase / maltogenic alpha-amylase / neopullulanase
VRIPDWVGDAVFYQIFPERFRNGDPGNDPPGTGSWSDEPTRENFLGGDLQGVIDALPYLVDLGVDAIYLNPIFAATTNHKYDTSDYFAIDPAFGTEATFDRLVAAAHAAGIRVVLDGVFNHCGLGFAPWRDVVERGGASRYARWFDVYDFPVRVGPRPNYATCGGAHYLPRLDTRHSEVEAFVHRVALHWLARGIDGWRLDVPYEVGTDFWRRFRTTVKAAYPDAYLVAEEWRDPSAFLRGDTFDGATHYGLRTLLMDFIATRALTGEAFLRALDTLTRRLPAAGRRGMLTLLGSHDTARALTLMGDDQDLLNVAFTALFTLPGAPLIYYGDEVGMRGGDDPGCRAGMLWDESRWNPCVRGHVKRLVAVRRRLPCLRRGAVQPLFANDRIAAYRRRWRGAEALVILNTTELPRRVRIPVWLPEGAILTDALSGDAFEVEGGAVTFEPMAPRRSWVLQVAGRS